MERQILIECGDAWFEFTKSRTGQLDFAGKVEGCISKSELDGFHEIASSTYFSPSFYIYVCDSLNMSPVLWIAPDVDVSRKDEFEYLLHVGALLAAVNAKDSLLAGELYLRRRNTFDQFTPLTQFIIEEISVEILFSLCFGRMQNVCPEDIPVVFDLAREKLSFDPSRESLEQAFMRYFKDKTVTVTLPLVGTQFYCWDPEPEVLERLCDNLSAEDLLGAASKIRKAKHDFYASLKTTVQAEPYNLHDVNAILVCIENIEAKICGNPGMEKAGHIRALAAKVLRVAKAKKMAYKAELTRLSGGQIVVKLEA